MSKHSVCIYTDTRWPRRIFNLIYNFIVKIVWFQFMQHMYHASCNSCLCSPLILIICALVARLFSLLSTFFTRSCLSVGTVNCGPISWLRAISLCLPFFLKQTAIFSRDFLSNFEYSIDVKRIGKDYYETIDRFSLDKTIQIGSHSILIFCEKVTRFGFSTPWKRHNPIKIE